MTSPLVSVHGGHSGEFCCHARDTLEAMVQAYIAQGFSWVGITEHIPPVHDKFLMPEERDTGLDVEKMQARFSRYMETCRALQKKYASRLKMYVAFEIETCTGSDAAVRHLVKTCEPDYIVGSVHHVNDLCIDFTQDEYQRAIESAGSIETLYEQYFDAQHAMLAALRPAVVGHFDLVRIFDPEYKERMQKPAVWKKILRNLELVKKLDLTLDFNLRALAKGASEPYITADILKTARDMKIRVLPGDDSHSVDTVGLHVEWGIQTLETMGFDTRFQVFPNLDCNIPPTSPRG